MVASPRHGRRVFFAASALMLAAAAVRAPGLGRWCYAVDEFYFSRSVGFILERGVPEFSTGGFYNRGLLLQYLSALPALALGGQSELTDRLVPLLFGIAGVGAFYALVRRYLREPFACACALALVVSSWHIEFSRFARFYSAFSFIFLVFLYALYRGYWRHDRGFAAAAWVTALIAPLLYEAAIFLPFLMGLPILRSPKVLSRRNLGIAAGTGALLAWNYLMTGISYRSWGVHDALPPGFPAAVGRTNLKTPVMDLLALATSSFGFSVGLVALATLGVWSAVRDRRSWTDPLRAGVGLALLALPLLHQYGTLALTCVLYGLARPRARDSRVSALRTWAPYLAASVAFWLAVAALSSSWHPEYGWPARASKLAVSLFSHFEIHASLVRPFATGVPILAAILFVSLAASLVRNLRTSRADLSRFPLMVVVLCIFVLPVFDTTYQTTRYSFFYYPVVLSLVFTESYALCRWLVALAPTRRRILVRAAAVAPLLVLAGSEDFFARRLIDVSSAEVNFRTGRFAPFLNHWYARLDYESPARFVNEHYRPGDVIVLDAVVSSQYLEHPFVNYVSRDLGRFRGISRERGTTELWTGCPLKYDLDGLASLVPAASTGSLWLVAAASSNSAGSFRTAAEVRSFAAERGLSASLEQVGLDGRIGVWRIREPRGSL